MSRAARRYRCRFLIARIRVATSARSNASSYLEAEPHNHDGRNRDDLVLRRNNEWLAHRRGSL
jgi:hypothetical protein